HKGAFGHVWVLGGARGFTGAPRLAAAGALAAGAGLVSIACPEDAYPAVAPGCLEAMVHGPETEGWRDADALVAGPGWGSAPDRKAWLFQALACAAPMVCDADALNMIAADHALREAVAARAGLTVLTPHPGEAARLLACGVAAVEKDRPQAALDLARAFDAWIVLKGVPTLIAAPDGRIWVNPFGSPALATAGSGDVLAGAIGALLARRDPRPLSPELAVPLAVALHGLAGEGEAVWRAGQIPDRLALWRIRLERGALAFGGNVC
ncbi:MAG: NAD(P)H-hydrate dehydratase, partial [Mariprofundaceae bacterium]